MPAPYRPYVLREMTQETSDIRSFDFSPADGATAPEFRAGQFFMLRINDVPNLKPPMRSYSAARAYTPDKLRFGIKLHGNFTHALFGKKKGDKLEISGPYGFFTVSQNDSPIVLLAAGIGITPLMCMAEELTKKKDRRQISLFYSNRELDDAAFMPILADLAKQNPNLRLVSTLTCDPAPDGWHGECGRIDERMLRESGVDFSSSHFYFCGPKAFNEGMQRLLDEAGVAKERIHKENW